MGKISTALRYFYAFFLLVLLLLLIFFIKQGNRLQTDLKVLLPQEQQWSDIRISADKTQEQRLNSRIVVLVGFSDAEKAFSSARDIAEHWQASELFTNIDLNIQPDLNLLRDEINQLSLALLPESVLTQLIHNPSLYFEQYAKQLMNPFTQNNLLPLEQDWLGFGRFINEKTQMLSVLQWNPNNGMLYLQQDDKTWVLLNAELKQSDFIHAQQDILDLINKNKNLVIQSGGELLAVGPALFAAVTKQQAEAESRLMSITGIGLTLLLLLSVFRTLKVLWLLLPVAVGMLCGIVAVIACFGQIHIMTLVVGTSLIGVLIDFPLHWFASSLFSSNWIPQAAMDKLRKTFIITLLVTLLGYALLWFTVLPVLKQTAVFSAAALIGAILSTLLFLPICFKHYQGFQYKPMCLNARFWNKNKSSYRYRYVVISALMLLCLIGLYKSKWQDDIRQWITIPSQMLQEAQQISLLAGIDLSNRYFLVTADNDEMLLEKDREISTQLSGLNQSYQSLSQWILSEKEQKQIALSLSEKIRSEDYAALVQLGVPEQRINHALKALSDKPTVSLQAALNTTWGRAWKNLYLGSLGEGKVGSLIKISDSADINALQNLSDQQEGVYWQDKRTHLNQAFQQTRDQAAWLKVLSFFLAGLLLWRLFGIKSAVKILSIPLMAIIVTIAVFGWLNISIGLFTMFGLLLVSAIGIDYTAYMHSAKESLRNKRFAVLLAAITTIISFLLLGLSSTPAVAAFGLSVSIGVAINVLITFKWLR